MSEILTPGPSFLDRIRRLEAEIEALKRNRPTGLSGTDQTIKASHDRLDTLLGAGVSAPDGTVVTDFNAATAEAIQGYAVQDHAPVDGEYLKYIGTNTRWEPRAIKFIGCRLRDSTNEATATGTWEYLNFDTESYDTDTMHEGVTNPSRITIKTAGVYAFGALIRWEANGTGSRLLRIDLNGSSNIGWDELDGNSTTETTLKIATGREFAANDYIEVLVRQTSGGGLNVLSHSDFSPVFWAHKIGDPT